MHIVVQKFGGTSVATKELRESVADIVIKTKEEGLSPVVVVSAIGRKGEPYATDTLIGVAKDQNPEIEPRELDLIMSCGETISAVILANIIKSKGYKSVALTGAQAGIITDNFHGNAEVVTVDSSKIMKYLEEDVIPVVTGFQGVTEYGDITTLGRGGSDTTASIVGEALKAKSIEIYTDVDGIMTADPRLVPNAKVIPKISYHEVFQLAEQGAKVIHPKAVQVAMRANIPLVIKNTLSQSEGTYITNCQYNLSALNPKERVVTGVTYIPNRAQISVMGKDIEDVELFDMLAENNISIDLINILNDRKVFTVNENELRKLETVLKNKNLKYSMITGCSKVTIIGDRMRGIPGVMAKTVRALSKENIDILQTSDSHTTISCLIRNEDVAKAIAAIHDEFKLGE